MDKIYVILIINGIVEDASDFAYEERQAAVSTFKHHFKEYIGDPDNEAMRFDECINGDGYIGFDNGHSSIQMKTVIS